MTPPSVRTPLDARCPRSPGLAATPLVPQCLLEILLLECLQANRMMSLHYIENWRREKSNNNHCEKFWEDRHCLTFFLFSPLPARCSFSILVLTSVCFMSHVPTMKKAKGVVKVSSLSLCFSSLSLSLYPWSNYSAILNFLRVCITLHAPTLMSGGYS